MDSFAKLSRSSVITKCRSYLRKREENIKKEKEEMIQKEMQRKRFIFFGSTFSREEAIANFKSDLWSAYHIVNLAGGYWADKVENLLSLALSTKDDVVFVSSEMAALLENY